MSDSQRPARAESWLDVYRAYKRELMVIAWNVTGAPDLAEDAIHDAFTRLLERSLSDVADYKTYAFQTVRNSARMLMRNRRRPAAPEHALPLDDIAAPPEPNGFVHAESTRELETCLRQLDADQREAICLHLHADLTFREIADLLGCPLGTVTSRYQRGLQRLREMLSRADVSETLK